MKNFLLFIFLALAGYSNAQTLNSVTPNNAIVGTTLNAQISGTGTLFQSSSPQGFFLEQGLTTIYASLGQANYIDDENMTIPFYIPGSAPAGLYNLQYSYTDTGSIPTIITLSLANAVTIYVPQFNITGNVFLDLNGNGTKEPGENGVMGQKINIMPDNQNFYTNSSGNYSIPTYTGNKTITWQSSPASGYTLSPGSPPSYTGNFSSNATGFDFGVNSLAGSLLSVTPDSVMSGTTLNAVISGAGTVFQNSSPQGTINYLQFVDPLGGGTAYGSNVIVINDSTFSASFSFPSYPTNSYWDLIVSYQDSTGVNILLTLPSSVFAYPPDIYLEGTAYADRDSNATRGLTESGVGGQIITIQPDNQTFTTDGSGGYKIPTSFGNKSITITPTGSFVVNPLAPATISGNYGSSTQNLDFPLLGPGPYLTAITPNTALAGTTLPALISGYGTVFQNSSPQGTIINSYLYNLSSSSNFPVIFNSILAIDDEHFSADFPIPANAPPGLYNLSVTYEQSPFNYVTLTLPNSVTISQPQLFFEGNTYLDVNNNGIKDGTEPGIPYQKVKIQPDNQYVFSDINGLYTIGSYPGTHTLQWDSTASSNLYLTPASPASYTATVTQDSSGFNFGLGSTSPPYSVDLLTLVGNVRCNQVNYFTLSYKNDGIVNYDARITLIKSSNMSYSAGSPLPTSINTDTIIYNISSVSVQQSGSINFSLGMPAAGSNIMLTAIIESLDGTGNVMESDSTIFSRTVACSYDPNDKAVSPPGVQSSNYTLMSSTLEYLIRFQNTGNDTAFTVTIRDTIDGDLDLSTFKMLDASHPVQTQIDVATRIVVFTFNNILLVDSVTNEPLSHGYVKYSIKPNSGLTNVTAIHNTAHIYFDLNDPVSTNTTFNTMVYSIPTALPEIDVTKAGIVRVVPNPFSDEAYVVFSNEQRSKYRFAVINLQGKLVVDETIDSERILVKKNNLSSGLYMFKLVPLEKGQSLSGKFIIK